MDFKAKLRRIESHKAVQKSKKGFLGVVFGRTFVIMVLLLLQIAFLFVGFMYLGDWVTWWYGSLSVLATIMVFYIINKRDAPEFTVAWVAAFALLPIAGVLLYFFVEFQIGSQWIEKRLHKMHEDTKRYWTQNEVVLQNLERTDAAEARLANYVEKWAGFPAYQNTSAKYFASGEEKYVELLQQLNRAQKFIFMEYFIMEQGYMWNTILGILERKVQEGVEVRVMYDGMCSLTLLPHNYPKKLQAKGIKCHMFAPIRPVLSTRQNNRDHRKIVVIDGHTAFTGGINLADEYINRKVRFGHWKDTAVMIQGEAVRSFTLMFLEMWNVEKVSRPETFDRYLEVPQLKIAAPGDGFVIPYGDSPTDNEPVGEQVYLDILYNAKEYVHIMTPYLILDHDMMTALTYAAKRGVDVKIIMPHIPDKKYAFVLAKTYYSELLEAGVEIYEYTPGFVHAKVFASDDCKAVVGTINLDFRSLYLHFECAVYMFQNAVIPDIERDFQKTLAKCHKVTIEEVKHRSLINKFMGRVLRLVAPLM